MTIKQLKWLLRNLILAVVIGLTLYLATCISAEGKENAEPAEAQPVVIPIELSTDDMNKVRADEWASETERTDNPNQSIVYAYNFDAYEKELLCKIAMAEAENQDTKGKALVMLIVLNRVWRDNEFSNTIKDVIYQPRQFSPILEGKFEGIEPDKDCWKALDLVMSGWDESQGALYFESKCESTWHKNNLKFLFKYGDHFFYTERS